MLHYTCSKKVLKKKSTCEKSNSYRSKVKVNNDDPEGDTTTQYSSSKVTNTNTNDICSLGTASGIAGEDILCLESQYSEIKRTLTTIEGKIIEGYQVTKQNTQIFITWQT